MTPQEEYENAISIVRSVLMSNDTSFSFASGLAKRLAIQIIDSLDEVGLLDIQDEVEVRV